MSPLSGGRHYIDPIWHVSFLSGEACCELLYPVTLLLLWVIVTDADASVTITQVAQKLHRASLYML